MAFGYCEDCEYWDAGAEGEVKPCSRINRDEVDVREDGSEIPAPEQTFSTRARYGCSLFEPIAGMGEGEGETERPAEGVRPENPDAPAPTPQSLDRFLT